MNNLEEFVYINRLLDMYGKLLTESQLEIMRNLQLQKTSLLNYKKAKILQKKKAGLIQVMSEKWQDCDV